MNGKNSETARMVEEQILDKGRLELIPEIFLPDASVHGPIYTIFLHPCHNHDDIREHVIGNRTGFPDLHHGIHGQLVEGDHVVTYFSVAGTNDGEFAGGPPTGKLMKGPGISIERFADGMIADSWQTCDRTLNFTQLGVIEPGLLPEYAIADADHQPAWTLPGESRDPAVVAANKAAVARLYDAFNNNDLAAINEIVRPDAVINMPGIDGTSREALVAFVSGARDGFGAVHDVELLVCDGDYVAALVRLAGAHSGEYFGRPATGRAVEVEIHQTWLLENGQVTGMYGLPDWFSAAAQLGPIPSADDAVVESTGPVTEHRNAGVMRGAYAALAKGDILTAYAVFAPDLVWHVPEGHRLAGIYEGRDTVFGMLGQLVTMTGGSLEMHVDHVLANDVRAVGLITSTATRNGKDFVAQEVHIFEMDHNGTVKVFWTLPQVPFPAEYWAGAPIGDSPPVPS